MTGTDREYIGEAGEYVLGTLDAPERAAFEARMANDSALMAEVAEWQRKLTPLSDDTAPIEPPASLFEKILAGIEPPDMSNVVMLKRRVAVWRGATAAVAAIAAALILFLLSPPRIAPPGQKSLYVAVLKASDSSAAFVAAVDVKNGIIAVRSVGPASPSKHSYELWALGGGRAAPVPLGVIGAVAHIPAERLGSNPLEATTFAVSLEPVGGSPTGAPTGPVLFTGNLLSTN